MEADPGYRPLSTEAFFKVYSDLDREGPGQATDVDWALSHINTPKRVLDAACGSGADTLTLAQALPDAQIDAIEKHGGFVTQAQARVSEHSDRVSIRQGDMLDGRGPYDLIWCAGAVYFKGIGTALTAWKPQLSEDGVVAFSEPVLPNGWTNAAKAFWDDYPAQDAAGILAQVYQAGYTTLDTRLIQGEAWKGYYLSLQSRIDALRAAGVSADVDAACVEAKTEIAKWTETPQDIAYLLVVARP